MSNSEPWTCARPESPATWQDLRVRAYLDLLQERDTRTALAPDQDQDDAPDQTCGSDGNSPSDPAGNDPGGKGASGPGSTDGARQGSPDSGLASQPWSP